MSENRLDFLKDSFPNFALQFSDDFAVIINPKWKENITVYDDVYEYTVGFSNYHAHCDEEEAVQLIRKIIDGTLLSLEHFRKGNFCMAMLMVGSDLPDLSYHKFKQLTGRFHVNETLEIADSLRVRGWDSKNNYDFSVIHEANGTVTIKKSFVGKPEA